MSRPAGRIMLVDDDELVRLMLLEALREAGWPVWCTEDPLTALAALESASRPALLVTDVMMPQLDGLTLSHRAVARHPELPVIYVTGYSGDLWRSIGPVLRSHTLKKPFRIRVLLDLVGQLLGDPPGGEEPA